MAADRDTTAAALICECSHHLLMHPEGGQTAPDRRCWGYVGSATPGPLRQPCTCTGFRPWSGPRDSRTSEPVRPLTMAIDARVNRADPETSVAWAERFRDQFAADNPGQSLDRLDELAKWFAAVEAEARATERQRILTRLGQLGDDLAAAIERAQADLLDGGADG